MKLSVLLQDGTITEAHFETYGCPTAIRCGDWLCKWLTGRPIIQAHVIEPKDLVKVIGGVPLGKEYCADLAIQALHNALFQTYGEKCK
jgi:NifU-like protein involved in Fe-S cluster formation